MNAPLRYKLFLWLIFWIGIYIYVYSTQMPRPIYQPSDNYMIIPMAIHLFFVYVRGLDEGETRETIKEAS